MQEENISGEESLVLIESMIKKAKNQFSENGDLYLLWGWWVFVCSIAEFILLNLMNFERHWLVWWTFPLVIAFQIWYLRKKRNRVRVRTYTDEIVGFVWLTFLVLMVLIVFLLARTNDPSTFLLIDPMFLILYGMPTFLSGIILKFRPLIIGGIGCWMLSMVATFVSPEYHLLLLPVAMLIAWIIPGYRLRRKFKQQTS
jgi:hypothetical protein